MLEICYARRLHAYTVEGYIWVSSKLSLHVNQSCITKVNTIIQDKVRVTALVENATCREVVCLMRQTLANQKANISPCKLANISPNTDKHTQQ